MHGIYLIFIEVSRDPKSPRIRDFSRIWIWEWQMRMIDGTLM